MSGLPDEIPAATRPHANQVNHFTAGWTLSLSDDSSFDYPGKRVGSQGSNVAQKKQGEESNGRVISNRRTNQDRDDKKQEGCRMQS